MTTAVARLFSRAAATSGGGREPQDKVACRLIEMAPANDGAIRSILEVGCGTGLLTEKALARYPAARLTAIDVACGMVQQVNATFTAGGRVRALAADARTFASDEPYDLILSSSALHWSIPLDATFENLRKLLKGKGTLVASIMLEGTLGELHRLRRTLVPDCVPSGRLPGRSEVEAALAAAGFAIRAIEEETIRVRYASAQDFLRSIHEQGVTGGAVSHGPRPLCRGELRRLAAAYDREFRNGDGSVYSSYAVLYLTATAV